MAGGGGGGGDYDVQLNLVPLIDILTNILFFLLIGFASEEMKYEGNLKLPSAGVNAEFTASLEITISRDQLLVGDLAVARIVDGRLDAKVDGDKIVPLYERLNTLRAERQAQTGGITQDADVAYLFADRDVPFTLLSPVMKTAAMAGYPNFRFAVVKK
jgi:biopolymer transport protein ExbD